MPRPRPQGKPKKSARAVKAATSIGRWGWLEWFFIVQSALTAVMFIPGTTPIRTFTRIAYYMLGLVAWIGVAAGQKKATVSGSFPSRPWLIFCIVWLLLSLAHPNSYSPVAAFGHAMLYISILSPAFWASDAVTSPRQIVRVMAILFCCNALSASLGIGQVFYPERFNPPVIPAMGFASGNNGDDLMYELSDGRKILRPCGLTDTPGAAAPAGAAAALMGLCFALRPARSMGLIRRGFCLAMAFAGVGIIYYSQVRSSMVVLALCLCAVMAIWTYRGEVRSALTLCLGGASIVGGALLWATRATGGRVLERFSTLVSDNPLSVYTYNRGAFVMHAFQMLAEQPLGLGLGWWGMVHMAFRDPSRLSLVWVEVMFQAWVVDGGIPLLVGYFGAILVALYDSARIALTTKDRELGFWAAVIVAQNLSSLALCFSFPTFMSPTGMQFWLLAAALHAADAQSRAAGRTIDQRPQPRPKPVVVRTPPAPV